VSKYGGVKSADWIEASGPQVCGEVDVAQQGRGTQGSSTGDAQSDYARACETADYVERIGSTSKNTGGAHPRTFSNIVAP
jgi:hypothetical protein